MSVRAFNGLEEGCQKNDVNGFEEVKQYVSPGFLKVLICFKGVFLKASSTVHCICGVYPSQHPGQKSGQNLDKNRSSFHSRGDVFDLFKRFGSEVLVFLLCFEALQVLEWSGRLRGKVSVNVRQNLSGQSRVMTKKQNRS